MNVFARLFGHSTARRDDDAWCFRGHGFYQLTGRHNYVRFARVIGKKPEALPAILCTREGAAESAAQFFVDSGRGARCTPPSRCGAPGSQKKRASLPHGESGAALTPTP